MVAENNFQMLTRQQQLKINFGGEIVQNLVGWAEMRQGGNTDQQTEQPRGIMGTPFQITGGQQQRQPEEGWTAPGGSPPTSQAAITAAQPAPKIPNTTITHGHDGNANKTNVGTRGTACEGGRGDRRTATVAMVLVRL